MSECPAVCDCCASYDFNGDDQGAYIGEGWCRFHGKPADPGDQCPDFVCFCEGT